MCTNGDDVSTIGKKNPPKNMLIKQNKIENQKKKNNSQKKNLEAFTQKNIMCVIHQKKNPSFSKKVHQKKI